MIPRSTSTPFSALKMMRSRWSTTTHPALLDPHVHHCHVVKILDNRYGLRHHSELHRVHCPTEA